MKILVGIPCFNCEKQIPRVLREFTTDVAQKVTEVMVVDNRSQDSTKSSALHAIAEFHSRFPKVRASVFENVENYGLGGSHKVIFNYAIEQGFDAVVVLHGDNQAKSDEILKMVSAFEEKPHLGAVLGSRFMSGSDRQNYSLTRTAGNMGLNVLYSLLTGRATHDLGSGLNLFKVSALKALDFVKFSDAFTFNMDLLLSLYKAGAEVSFVPITWRESDQISNAKAFRVGSVALKTLVRWRLGAQTCVTPRSYKSVRLP